MRERRQRGLTLRNLIKVSRELKERGELEPGMSQDDMAEVIFEQLVESDVTAFTEAGLDLEAILELIKKWLPIIMAIIALF
jgi:hypothetical protein